MDRLEALKDSRNSFEFWAVDLAGIPVPKTRIFTPADSDLSLAEWSEEIRLGFKVCPLWISDLIDVAEELGFPVFMRTDQASAKHKFLRTCFVASPDDLAKQLDNMLFEHLGLLGMPAPRHVVLREYLMPAAITVDGVEYQPFRAFGKASQLPIGAERRYFVRDGVVECHHPYWPEEAIHGVDPKATDWRERLRHFNHESRAEVTLLSNYARRIGLRLKGYWSFDFMLTEKKGWVFIDAGLGECSEHLPCEFAS